MIKTIAKCVFAVSLVAAAVSVSVTPSFAAKKKAAAKPAAACVAPGWGSTNCSNGVCTVTWCGGDGKWYPAPWFCWEPFCGPKV